MANKKYTSTACRAITGNTSCKQKPIKKKLIAIWCLLPILVLSQFVLNAQQTLSQPYDINTMKINLVRIWNATAPEQDAIALIGRPLKDIKQASQYFDGLGRPLQMVVKKGSLETDPNNPTSSLQSVDMMTSVVYDEFGRERYKYLPFASTAVDATKDNGLFKMNPFQQQVAFYNAQLNGQAGETFTGPNALNWAYSKTNFETSPLNRINESYAAGVAWVGMESDPSPANRHPVQINYWLNTPTDEVRIWKVTDGTFGSFGTYATPGTYGVSELVKNVIINEQGKQIIEFKDKEDKLILKKQQLTASADNGTGSGYPGWLCTYYIYDDFGSLRAVIQPRGVELISPNWSLISDATILAEQCFRYEYDAKKRMIIKKVPGSSPVYMVYDARDRLVMSQDGNMRAVNKWLVTKFENEFNREIETGSWVSATAFTSHLSNADASSSYPTTSSGYEELTKTFYDNYDWLTTNSGHGFSANRSIADDSYLLSPSSSFPYPQAVTQNNNLAGKLTGTKSKVLGTFGQTIYLYNISYYDERGRVIQTQVQNFSGGTDIFTSQYSWSDQLLLTIKKTVKGGANSQTITILTQNTYDDLGRTIQVDKKTASTLVNSGSMPLNWTTIVKNEYDKLGQLKKKKIGNKPNAAGAPLANLEYEYNVRGWMLSLNKNYVLASNNSDQYFGMELGYDKNGSLGTFTPQYNGNISGTVWKSEGDQQKRKYDFSYDAVDRLTGADFNQYVSGSGSGAVFNKSANVDFSVSNLSFDANGNIMTMQQSGLKVFSSSVIDNLTYQYQNGNYSNKLARVTDAIAGDNKLGDFKDGTNIGTDDYSYDVNGNLQGDNNKKVDWINYNYLNLIEGITVRDINNVSNSIIYKYDASGNKIQKEVYPGAVPPGKVTLYLGSMIFQDDVLQTIDHEEGRIRFKPAAGVIPASFVYDYFIKDHLGNIRIVLTEGQQQDIYPAATLENATYNGGTAVSTEDDYYSIDPSKIVDQVAATGIPVYQNNNGNPPYNNNPYSNITANSAKLYQLNATTNTITNKTGLGIVLKVMAGDQINIYGKSYHKKPTFGYTLSTNPIAVLDLINAFAGASIISAKGITGSQITSQPGFPSTISSLIGNQPAQTTNTPQASINWIVLDEQFKYVAGGFDMVGTAVNTSGTFKVHDLSSIPTIPIPKNGYIYVYCSNESQYNVFFDNLQVFHTRGSILEETHYYPYGNTLAGISSKSLNAGDPANKYKYNGIEQNNEYDLNMYDARYRNLDPQIGRFWQVDPKPGYAESPYATMGNNPIRFSDLLGDTAVDKNGKNVTITRNADGTLSYTFDASYSAKEKAKVEKSFMKGAAKVLNSLNNSKAGQKIVDRIASISTKVTVDPTNYNRFNKRLTPNANSTVTYGTVTENGYYDKVTIEPYMNVYDAKSGLTFDEWLGATMTVEVGHIEKEEIVEEKKGYSKDPKSPDFQRVYTPLLNMATRFMIEYRDEKGMQLIPFNFAPVEGYNLKLDADNQKRKDAMTPPPPKPN